RQKLTPRPNAPPSGPQADPSLASVAGASRSGLPLRSRVGDHVGWEILPHPSPKQSLSDTPLAKAPPRAPPTLPIHRLHLLPHIPIIMVIPDVVKNVPQLLPHIEKQVLQLHLRQRRIHQSRQQPLTDDERRLLNVCSDSIHLTVGSR